MFLFLIPLLLGFAFNSASAFTAAFSRRWGEKRGSFITLILRNILGIPVWAAGFGLAIHTPSPLFFAPMIATKFIGVFMITAGGMIILIALVAIRSRAAMPSTRDTLVQNGIYAHVRHPIHSGTFLEFMGIFLLKPSHVVAAACALGIGWILIQTGLEEYDLLQRLPDYREYMNQVPRFFPRLRMKQMNS